MVNHDLIDGTTVEAEAVGAFDRDIKDFADSIFISFKNDDFIRAGASHQSRAVGFAQPFAEDFSLAPNKLFVGPARRSVNEFEQITVTVLLHRLVDLIRHFRRWRL